MQDFILIAVTDPLVSPEATHAAAATGREVMVCEDPRDIARHAARAGAIVVDKSTAAHVGACSHRAAVYFLAPDPGPLDYAAALSCHATAAFIVPAESTQLLAALGQETTTPRAMTRPPGPGGPEVVAVVGAAGGLGASTFAAALARTAAPSLLIDADPKAGGLDLLLGLEETAGLRWPELNVGEGHVDAVDARRVLPTTADGIALLSGVRATIDDPFELSDKLLDTTVSALQGPELMVVDGAVPEPAHHVVMLCAPEVRAAAAAAGLARTLEAQGRRVYPVVRMRGWNSLTVEDVEAIIHQDVVAEIPHLRRLARTIETTGVPAVLPRPLHQACQRVLENLGWVP